MQAVILVAGRGTRMGALTESIHKSMLKVAGKTLLEHKFEALPEGVDEIVLVIGHGGEAIREHFGGTYDGKSIRYAEQQNPVGGTADALWQARGMLSGKFFVMNGDNLYARRDMEACLPYEWAVLVQERDEVRTGAVFTDANGRVTAISENTEHRGEKGYANTGLYVLDARIFAYPQVPKAAGSSEVGLPQTMVQAVRDIAIQAVPAHFWIEIKTPEDLKKAEELLARQSA